MTLRNRAMIGSSFKSSFSLAATSMEYVRNTDFTSAACTEICHGNISSRATSQPSFGPTYLCFPHDFAPRPDPRNEDELLTLGLFVVRVRDADVDEGGFSGV
jgi:hypothetical protein